MTTHALVFVRNKFNDGHWQMTNCRLDVDREMILGNPIKLCSTLKEFLMVEDACQACVAQIEKNWGKTLAAIVSEINEYHECDEC